MQDKLPGRVIVALGRIGPASPMEVAQALGEDPTKVRVTLRRLDQDRRIKRTGYGRYELPAVPRPVQESTFTYIENEIVKLLKAKGGMARKKEIDREFWSPDAGPRPYLAVVVTQVLGNSARVERVRHGLYRLSGEAR